MRQIILNNKSNKIHEIIKRFLISLLVNYLLYALWISLFILLKYYIFDKNLYFSGPISTFMVYGMLAVAPLVTAILKVIYYYNGSVLLILFIWLISLFFIFLVPLTVIYSIKIF